MATIFKECNEFPKKQCEQWRQAGVHKRNKELLSWAKKKKSFIRREDLIAFLNGRHHNNHIFQRYSRSPRHPRASEDFGRFFAAPTQVKTSPMFLFDQTLSSPSLSPSEEADENLTTFTEALTRKFVVMIFSGLIN